MQQEQKKAHSTDLDEAEKLAWLQLIRTENVGPITFYRLVERFGTAQKAIEALPDFSRRGGRAKPLKAPPMAAIEKERDRLAKCGGTYIYAGGADYPLPLSAVEDAPPVLSVIGRTELLTRPALAIVGARNASLNGRKFAHRLARELGACGQLIVSGLARGIDTAAHDGALETGTIAVLAGGADIIYPQENAQLYEQIRDRGLIVAESPPGTEPIARHFPRRNRIISGLAAGVVVVEATLRSGSLITARLAGEQGRDVYAVPGHPMDPRAQGPNKLLQDGAVLVQSAQDVLQNLSGFTGNGLCEPAGGPTLHPDPTGRDLAETAERCDENALDSARAGIIENLSPVPVTVDELIRACHVTIPVVQTILLELELAGRLQRLPGNRVSLIE